MYDYFYTLYLAINSNRYHVYCRDDSNIIKIRCTANKQFIRNPRTKDFAVRKLNI